MSEHTLLFLCSLFLKKVVLLSLIFRAFAVHKNTCVRREKNTNLSEGTLLTTCLFFSFSFFFFKRSLIFFLVCFPASLKKIAPEKPHYSHKAPPPITETKDDCTFYTFPFQHTRTILRPPTLVLFSPTSFIAFQRQKDTHAHTATWQTTHATRHKVPYCSFRHTSKFFSPHPSENTDRQKQPIISCALFNVFPKALSILSVQGKKNKNMYQGPPMLPAEKCGMHGNAESAWKGI